MSMTKLNVFHWHIVDSQSFPYVVKTDSISNLTLGLLPGQLYTQENVSFLINYAMDRGIRVIPEFDSPGHTTSWALGIPEIGACVAAMPWGSYAAEPPAGQLNPNHPLTTYVVQTLYQEIAEVFQDTFVHIGADEVNTNCWVAFNVAKNTQAAILLYQTYLQNLSSYITGTLKKNVIAWDDSVIAGLDIPKDVLIEIWHADSVEKVTSAGYQAIIANYDTNYLDCGIPDWISGGPSWCGNTHSWWDIYTNSNFNGVTQGQVVGGEVAMWSEVVDDANIIQTIWPRAIAAGELFWSHINNPSINSVLLRYAVERQRMYSLGYQVSPVHPTYCDIYPSQCLN